jgi:hypothetical protein
MLKKYKKIIFIFSFLSLFACKNDEIKLSIPTAKMVSILADIHVAESAAAYLSSTQKDSMTSVYYNQIYEIHNVKAEEVKQNLDMIKREPIQLEKIYKMVIDTLEGRFKVSNGK